MGKIQRVPIFHFLLVTALFCGTLAQFYYYFVSIPFSMHGVDFTVTWRACRQFIGGQPVYLEPFHLEGPDGWEVFKYPQFLLLFFAWLSFFPLPVAEMLWKLLMLCSLLALGGISIRFVLFALGGGAERNTGASPSKHFSILRHALLAVGVLFALSTFSPLSWSLQLGQPGPLLALILMAAWVSLEKRREQQAGVWLACGAWIKILPGLLFIPAGLRRRWKIFRGAVFVTICYLVVLLILGRLSDEWYYFSRVLPSISYQTRGVSHSLTQGLMFFFGVSVEAPAEKYVTTQRLITLCFLAIYTLVLGGAARMKASPQELYEIALAGLPVITPVLEGHHFVILWPLWVSQFRQLIASQRFGLGEIVPIFAWIPIFLVTSFHHLFPAAHMAFLPSFASAVLWLISILKLKAWAPAYAPR